MEEDREIIVHLDLDVDSYKKMMNPVVIMTRVMTKNIEEKIDELATSSLSRCKYHHLRVVMMLGLTLNGDRK